MRGYESCIVRVAVNITAVNVFWKPPTGSASWFFCLYDSCLLIITQETKPLWQEGKNVLTLTGGKRSHAIFHENETKSVLHFIIMTIETTVSRTHIWLEVALVSYNAQWILIILKIGNQTWTAHTKAPNLNKDHWNTKCLIHSCNPSDKMLFQFWFLHCFTLCCFHFCACRSWSHSIRELWGWSINLSGSQLKMVNICI